MGDREGSGVNEPARATLKKAEEEEALSEKVEHNLGSAGEGFNHLDMVWYEENREKAEHGVMELSIQPTVSSGGSFSSDSEDPWSSKLQDLP